MPPTNAKSCARCHRPIAKGALLISATMAVAEAGTRLGYKPLTFDSPGCFRAWAADVRFGDEPDEGQGDDRDD